MGDETFDIKDHIVMYDGEEPKNKKELEDLLGVLMSRPLPASKAAWQFIIIPSNYGPHGSSCHVLLRFHHSIADGISLFKVFMKYMMDQSPEYRAPAKFGAKGKTLRVLKTIFLGPYFLIKCMLMNRGHHGLNKSKLSGEKRVTCSEAIDLSVIQKIKNCTRCTVNDVLLSCLAGALRQHFLANALEVPKEIVTSIPVDTRPMTEAVALNNRISLVFMKLPIDMDEPLLRLQEVHKRTELLKASPEPLMNGLVIQYFMAWLPNWFTSILFDWFSDKCTMIVSNIVGPQNQQSVCDKTCLGMTFWPPQRSSVGLGVSILSYNDTVRIGVVTDKLVLTTPTSITDSFMKQLHELSAQLKLE